MSFHITTDKAAKRHHILPFERDVIDYSIFWLQIFSKQRLPRLVGKGRAKELIFTCDRIDAQEAWRIGLVNKVVAREELMNSSIAMAENILSKGSYAISLAKSCIETGMDTDLSSGLMLEANQFALSFSTADKKEGMTAFLEKRPANLTDF